MTCLRFRAWPSSALLLVLALSLEVSAQQPSSYYSRSKGTAEDPSARSADQSYKIYSLDGLGEDEGFGAWVAQTIPEVIATGTWKEQGVIRYYAPKNILVVSHTPEVQAKVDGFLKDMKKALPGKKKAAAAQKRTARTSQVIPAAYQEPSVLRGTAPVAESSIAYPVPTQAKPPKHLFHFIIRYEGEGLVDDNIVKAMKAYYQAEKKANEAAPPSAASAPAVSCPSSAAPAASGAAISTSAPAATLPETITQASKDSEKKENKEDGKEEKKDSTKEKNKDEEKESSEQPWYFYSLR